MVPNVVKSREGWELYIVTDGVMFGTFGNMYKREDWLTDNDTEN
jgi:hypothetical protein